jgi:hypothetical protein
MSHPDPTTFSVDVLAFPGAADEAQLASSIAAAFGIPDDDARRLVASAPVAVKKGADAETTREIAKVLLGLGAEICIRNERTGEERIHHSSSIPPDPISSLAPGRPSRPPPSSQSRAPGAPSHAPAARSDPPRPHGDRPRSSFPPPSEAPDSAAILAAAARRISSKPPALDVCAACSRRIDKGEDCASCGWSNQHKRRSCRECHRDLSVVSDLWPGRAAAGDLVRRKLPIVALPVLVLGCAAAALHFHGTYPAAMLLVLPLAIAFVIVGGATALRCVPCRRKVETFQLQLSERKQVSAARRRWFLAALLSSLVGVGMTAPLFAARSPLHVDSFGIGWTATTPWSHRTLERRTAVVQGQWGPARFTIHRALNPSFEVRGYYLLHTMLPEKADPGGDPAAFEALLQRAVDAAAPGAKLGPTEVVQVAAGRARDGALAGTLDGRPIAGRARALVVERDVVVVMFVSDAGAPAATAGLSFLESLTATSGQ